MGWLLTNKRQSAKAPSPGIVVVAPRESQSDYFTGDITPTKLKSVLRAAAEGEPAEQNELFDTMLDRDGHLRSVYETRLLGLNGLDWELVPANEVGKHPKIDEKKAQAVQEFCAEVIADIANFDATLAHLADAIGRGCMVAEVEWANQVPIALHPVEPVLLRGDWNDIRRLRVTTDANQQGVAMDEFPPGKFLVHCPKTIGGSKFRGGLLRPALFIFMPKRYGWKYWQMGIELFGLPVVIGKYGAEGDKTVREELSKLITKVGAARGGMFPIGTEIEAVDGVPPGQWPHERIMKYCDAEYSKEFLGQTLTTEIGETGGARAAAQVHDEVREDLRDSDIRNEGTTIREQLLVPLAMLKFGEEDGRRYAPYFRRVVEEVRDLGAAAQLVSVAVNDLGVMLPKSIVEDELGLPLAEGENREDSLPGRKVAPSPFGGFEGIPVENRHAASGCQCRSCGTIKVQNRRLAEIMKRRSPLSRMASWIIAAVTLTGIHAGNVMAAATPFIDRKRDLQTALGDLPELFDELPLDEMRAIAEQSILAARLAGIADSRHRLERRPIRKVRNQEISFERIPFEAAVESLRDRIGLDPETFLELDTQARSRAWRVAGVTNMQLLAVVHRELVASIAAGETSRDFRLRLPQMATANGWAGENPWHADLVHLQNFAMAHVAGRQQEYEEFGVPAVRIVATGTSCPICSELIGKVFAVADTAKREPFHFGCDCDSEPVFEDEPEAGEIVASSAIATPNLDAERARRSGFRFDPRSYANLEPLKLGGFPEDLRPVFRQFGEGLGWEVTE